MKIFFSIFCIIFFYSNNLLADTNLLCKSEWSVTQYPYTYMTVKIVPDKYVYIFDTDGHPTYYYDSDKYTDEDIKDYESAETKSITWNNNFIELSRYYIDLINLILVKKRSQADIVFVCEITRRKI